MQIAGRLCTLCGEVVVLQNEGLFCPKCDAVIHRVCAMSDRCPACEKPWHTPAPPARPELRDALLPPALRSGTGTSSFIGVLLVAVLILLGVGFAILLFNALFQDGKRL